MGIGQPAMSAALARLREVFNDPILVKTRGGLEPTARAQELARSVHDALAMIDEAARGGRPFVPATAQAHLTVLASEGVALTFMPALMERARRDAPGLHFTFRPGDVRRSLEYLRDGEADLVISYLRAAPIELRRTILFRQDLVCIASAHHPAVRGSVSLQQFVDWPHVVWGAAPVPFPTIEALVEDELQRRGVKRIAALRVPNVLLSPSVVAATDLLAVVPERIAVDSARTLPLQLLPMPFALGRNDISMFWHERMHRDPAHVWLRSVLTDIASTQFG
jgi:DNA-binding transcriptional LysR family regulator